MGVCLGSMRKLAILLVACLALLMTAAPATACLVQVPMGDCCPEQGEAPCEPEPPLQTSSHDLACCMAVPLPAPAPAGEARGGFGPDDESAPPAATGPPWPAVVPAPRAALASPWLRARPENLSRTFLLSARLRL
jgi:hypothetical protein